MSEFVVNYILGYIPTWIWPATAGAAAVVYFLAHMLANFPNVKVYAVLIKPVSFAAMLLGVFMYGGAGVTAVYQAEIQQLQNKINVAQQASDDANVAVETKIVTRTKLIHDTKKIYQDRIHEVAKVIDAECHLDPDVVSILNSAAKNPLGDSK